MKKITLEEAQLLWDLGNREVRFKVSVATSRAAAYPTHKCTVRPTGRVYVHQGNCPPSEYFIPSSTSEDS